MRNEGCRTGAVDHLFSMKEWFIRGYEDYLVPPGRSRSPGSVINEMAFPWLDEHASEDFFLFLHFWDAHIPYVPPEPFLSRYTAGLETVDPELQSKLRSRPSYPLFKRNLYDVIGDVPSLEYIEALHYAEIAYLDHEIGRLRAKLESLGVLDDCTMVIFGDHGENMTEHDSWFDHAGLYDSVVHVPLMIRSPGRVAPTRIDDLVQLVDVMPTLLELHDMSDRVDMADLDGKSMVPLIKGETLDHRNFVVLSECTWQAKRAVRNHDWKYIRCWDAGIYPRDCAELYHLPSDPTEQRNLAQDRPDVVAQMDAVLQKWLDDRVDGDADPMHDVIQVGLPAVRRLEGVVLEDAALVSGTDR
jgi:arylsulfatase A-like enzyme